MEIYLAAWLITGLATAITNLHNYHEQNRSLDISDFGTFVIGTVAGPVFLVTLLVLAIIQGSPLDRKYFKY